MTIQELVTAHGACAYRRVVERLDLVDSMAGLGFRVRNVFVNGAIEASELFQDDCTQRLSR
jgi:hypothetical protein